MVYFVTLFTPMELTLFICFSWNQNNYLGTWKGHNIIWNIHTGSLFIVFCAEFVNFGTSITLICFRWWSANLSYTTTTAYYSFSAGNWEWLHWNSPSRWPSRHFGSSSVEKCGPLTSCSNISKASLKLHETFNRLFPIFWVQIGESWNYGREDVVYL